MEVSAQLIKQVGILIIIAIGILIFIFLLDQLTGGHIFRAITCAAIFWIPFGAMFSALTQGCAAIPI